MKGSRLFCACLLMAGCHELLVPDPDTTDPMLDFNAAWRAVKTVYPFFGFKHINWDSIYTVYRPRAERAHGDEIDEVLFSMLAELRDGHVSLQTRGGSQVSTYQPPRKLRDAQRYSQYLVRRYVNRELRLAGNDAVEYEIMAGSIGYIHVASLSKDLPVLDGFDEALQYVRETRGLLLDVRGNGGGTDEYSIGIVSRLIQSPVNNLPYRAPDGALHPGPLISPGGPFQYLKRVVLLINGTCFSSCEDFAEMMRNVPTVTSVGDTTSGASGAPQSFPLPSGRVVRISTLSILGYNGQPLEWNGVPPQIRVVNTAEEVSEGVDRQLERALQVVLQP